MRGVAVAWRLAMQMRWVVGEVGEWTPMWKCRHYCRWLPRGPATHLDAVLLAALLRWEKWGFSVLRLPGRTGGVPVSTP